jgi:serine/threonine-protein kinase PRP4
VVITSELVSRFYRAPEIILGYAYDTKIDIWSLGCSLYELYTGKILFSGRNNNEMLKLIMQTRGKIPSKLIKRGQYANSYFNDRGDFLSLELDAYTKEEYVKELNVNNYPIKDLGYLLKNEAGNDDLKLQLQFKDFLEKCLHLDPAKRLTALELLTHEFIGILPTGVFSK